MIRHSGSAVLLKLITCCIVGVCSAQQPEPQFAGVVIYGTDKLDPVELTEEFTDEAETLMELMSSGDTERMETTGEAIAEEIRAAIAARGDFAQLDIGWGMDGSQGSITTVITVEIVEEADRARRMPFRNPPSGTYADPDGVLAAWEDYESEFLGMMMSGELFEFEQDCPVLHCLASFEPPQLAPYLDVFNRAAAAHEDLLYEIAEYDQIDRHRSGALQTLAHTNDAERLLPVLGRAIHDSSGTVRNIAMRIMLFIAEDHPTWSYPVADLIQAMDFPGSAERNKAAYVLSHLAGVPEHAAIIREQGLPNTLRLLRTPGDLMHGPALTILQQLSGEEFAPRDYAAWEAWAESNGAAQ